MRLAALLILLLGCQRTPVWHVPDSRYHQGCGGQGFRVLRLAPGPHPDLYWCSKCKQHYPPYPPVRVR